MIYRTLFLALSCLFCIGLPLNAQQIGDFKLHAHRGGSAHYPENSIEAMLYSASIGIPVLELDVHMTGDNKVVVSHDPFLNPKKVVLNNGEQLIGGSQLRYIIYHMAYGNILKYDIGSLPVKEFPNRINLPASMPLLSQLIDEVEQFTQINGLPPVTYNIEIKSHRLKDNRMSPPYKTYTNQVMKVISSKHIDNRIIIQSFDPRTLNYLNRAYPNIKLSYLLSSSKYPLKTLYKKLDFTPAYFSPSYKLVTPGLINDCHKAGMKIVPWTVNHREDIQYLYRIGVDGIITDYPKLAQEWLK